MSIQIETVGLVLSDKEEIEFKRLFKWLLYRAKSPDPAVRIRGNVIIALSGEGKIGVLKVESFHDLSHDPK